MHVMATRRPRKLQVYIALVLVLKSEESFTIKTSSGGVVKSDHQRHYRASISWASISAGCSILKRLMHYYKVQVGG